MATLTSTSAARTAPVPGKSVPAGVQGVAWGYYPLTADPVPADIIQLCRLPAGATVIGGFVQAEDVDTNASETFDFDVGWEANATEIENR